MFAIDIYDYFSAQFAHLTKLCPGTKRTSPVYLLPNRCFLGKILSVINFDWSLSLMTLLSFSTSQEKMKDKVDLICKHDINVFVNRQLIYNYPEQLFADKGVMAIEHADFDGIERLALVTGGEIVSTFGNPELVKLGKCDVIEQVGIIAMSKTFQKCTPRASRGRSTRFAKKRWSLFV